MIWTAEKFIIEFNKIEYLRNIPILQYEINKVDKIVEHWKKCAACKLGFDFSEYDMSFEELFIKLAACHLEYHICDGDYKLLFTKSEN